MKIYTYLALFLFLFSNCKSTSKKNSEAKKYSHWVGDIHFDANLDNEKLLLCDSTHVIHRRNGLTYPGGKDAIKNECLKKYKYLPENKSFSGYIMVRFIINCKKETGRFRIQPMDFDFSLTECPNNLKEQLLSIVKGLKEWESASEKDKGSDFSKYLNFKIQNGQIENILH